jgi:mRNA interferase RelE/StbE
LTVSDPVHYRLKFLPEALAEWNALDGSIKETLRKVLKKRLLQPRLPGSELHGDLRHCYKIKLRKQGYRLVYQARRKTSSKRSGCVATFRRSRRVWAGI